MRGQLRLRGQYNPSVYFDFVLIELDLGVTFCQLALSSRHQEVKLRNIRNARKAYDSALRFVRKLSPSSAQWAVFDEKASRLKVLFERLGVNP
jgi:hypothetical protein